MVVDGNIVARGASDDKGQVYCHLKAFEYLIRETGELPLNVKILIEGEEEIGSQNLPAFAEAHRDLLQADVVVLSDTPMFDVDVPSICYSLRGLVYAEIELRTLREDLHSGQHGGAVPNAIQALITLLNRVKDEKGKIQVPFFYDDVLPIDAQVRKQVLELGFDEQAYQLQLGATFCQVKPVMGL
jgi:Acetylornithine deacetylase/Succinyl-diaminopimelate desuccinylase and related deacylases